MQVVRENEAKRIRKMIAKPSFVRHSIFENGVIGIELRKLKIELCKPIYVGMSVLDLSKLLMYDFLYNNLKVRAVVMLSFWLLFSDSNCFLILIV